MLNELIGAVLQILVFALIPFLVYLIRKKTAKGFFEYVGLKKSTRKANVFGVLACLIFAAPLFILVFISDDFRAIMFDPSSITGKFRQQGFGFNSLTILLITALFKTSFAEELIFRGFVAKRLIAITNFKAGNILQAIIFGVIHLGLFMSITDNLLFLTVILVIPSVGAYVSVYLNEKVANGSIIPGWISHGLANVLSYSIIGFVI